MKILGYVPSLFQKVYVFLFFFFCVIEWIFFSKNRVNVSIFQCILLLNWWGLKKFKFIAKERKENGNLNIVTFTTNFWFNSYLCQSFHHPVTVLPFLTVLLLKNWQRIAIIGKVTVTVTYCFTPSKVRNSLLSSNLWQKLHNF